VRLSSSRQYPAGVLLPPAVPSLRRLIESFPLFTEEQHLAIALVHAVQALFTHFHDHIRDMLRAHVCDAKCIYI
jgi:hypothetical protein